MCLGSAYACECIEFALLAMQEIHGCLVASRAATQLQGVGIYHTSQRDHFEVDVLLRTIARRVRDIEYFKSQLMNDTFRDCLS
jgi:hypothetical protein